MEKYRASAAAGCESCAKILVTGRNNGVPAHPPTCPHSKKYVEPVCANCTRLENIIKERDETIKKFCEYVVKTM